MKILGPGPITKIRAALGRAARSAAQAALLVIGADAVDLFTVDLQAVLGAAGGMALVSLLTSVAFPPPEVGTVLATTDMTER